MRASIVEGLKNLGLKTDDKRNDIRGKAQEISADDSSVKIFVIPTNEELMIAKETLALTQK